MSIVDKLSHLNSLNNRLGSYEERLSALVAAIGGHYPVGTPEGGGRSSNLTQAGSDNDSLLETFDGHNRFAVFVLDRVEQHLAHLQQYVHGEGERAPLTAKGADVRHYDTTDAFAAQVPDSVTIGGVTYTRL